MGRKRITSAEYLERLRNKELLRTEIEQRIRRSWSLKTSYVNSTISNIRMSLRREGASLRDIGSSADELRDIRRDGHFLAALTHLTILREGTLRHERHAAMMLYELRKARRSLNDLPTDEMEIRNLRVKGCKLVALRHARSLVQDSPSYEVRLRLIKRILGQFDLQPQDAGLPANAFDALRSS
jgi:hypothetical protein